MSADLTVPPPMPPYVYGRECGENERVLPIERVYARDAIWSERVASLQARLEAATKALDHIARRLQIDIDDGSRPDQWSMEDLVRTARAASQEGK